MRKFCILFTCFYMFNLICACSDKFGCDGNDCGPKLTYRFYTEEALYRDMSSPAGNIQEIIEKCDYWEKEINCENGYKSILCALGFENGEYKFPDMFSRIKKKYEDIINSYPCEKDSDCIMADCNEVTVLYGGEIECISLCSLAVSKKAYEEYADIGICNHIFEKRFLNVFCRIPEDINCEICDPPDVHCNSYEHFSNCYKNAKRCEYLKVDCPYTKAVCNKEKGVCEGVKE